MVNSAVLTAMAAAHEYLSSQGYESIKITSKYDKIFIETKKEPDQIHFTHLTTKVLPLGSYLEWNDKHGRVTNVNRDQPVLESKECKHEDKYKNIVSANLRFWSCVDCGKDLGDIDE